MSDEDNFKYVVPMTGLYDIASDTIILPECSTVDSTTLTSATYPNSIYPYISTITTSDTGVFWYKTPIECQIESDPDQAVAEILKAIESNEAFRKSLLKAMSKIQVAEELRSVIEDE